MITLAKGAQRAIEDWHLSRYACYLIVQNADPSKAIVALGQTYFALQTRRQEMADQAALEHWDEDTRRLKTREQLTRFNKELAATAQGAGVATPMDFAIFQDHGYAGLYNGEHARDIAARKGLARGQAILDLMSSEELAANLFRVTQTEAKIRREGIQGRSPANQTHHVVGRKVRQTIPDYPGAGRHHAGRPANAGREHPAIGAQAAAADAATRAAAIPARYPV